MELVQTIAEFHIASFANAGVKPRWTPGIQIDVSISLFHRFYQFLGVCNNKIIGSLYGVASFLGMKWSRRGECSTKKHAELRWWSSLIQLAKSYVATL